MATRYKLQQFDWGFRCYDSQTEQPIEGEVARYEIPMRLEKAVRWGATITPSGSGLEISKAVNPALLTVTRADFVEILKLLKDPDTTNDPDWSVERVEQYLESSGDEWYFLNGIETTLEANTAEGGTI